MKVHKSQLGLHHVFQPVHVLHARVSALNLNSSSYKKRLAYSLLTLFIALPSTQANADVRDQAKRIYDRIAGVAPSETELQAMVNDLGSNPTEAMFIDAAKRYPMNNKHFYNVTLKNWITPWTNEDANLFAPLNDFTATAIGMIRDDLDFRTVLSDDIIYIAKPSLGLPPYSTQNNTHYEQLENGDHNLKTSLERQQQSVVTGLPSNATAGIMTTRAAAKAYFSGGTNRAMLRFTALNFLCNDMEQFRDTTRPTDRIRQDVSRSPGGDSRIFMNQCVGCHSGMDPLAQAFAYYEWQDGNGTNGNITYTPNQVQNKYHINSGNFKWGYHTPNDQWINYWRKGPNALWVGWPDQATGFGYQTNANGSYTSGSGAKSLGIELAGSRLFAECQAKKIFKTICFRDPESSSDVAVVQQMTTEFANRNGNIKYLFGQAAYHCRGQ